MTYPLSSRELIEVALRLIHEKITTDVAEAVVLAKGMDRRALALAKDQTP